MLAEQSAGTCDFHVLVDGDGEVVGGSTWSTSPTVRPSSIAGSPSQAVLTRAGFVLAGSVELDGQPEVRFVRDLTVDGTGRPADR